MKTISKDLIFCIIPAYNESGKIAKVVQDVKNVLDNIVVIDDGSSDNTGDIAEENGAIVLKHIVNRGQGAALQTGNEYALENGAEIIVHFDGDDQFEFNEIEKIIEPLVNERCDIVFGSRFLDIKHSLPAFKKYIIYPIARMVNRIFVGSSLSDPQNGFRAMSRKTANIIKIKNDGMAHNSEIQYKAYLNKLAIEEVPVTVKYSQFGQGILSGKGRASGGVRIVVDLLLSRIMN